MPGDKPAFFVFDTDEYCALASDGSQEGGSYDSSPGFCILRNEMHIRAFDRLNPEECELILRLPVLVCILIAGADGKIDDREIRKAISIAAEKKESKGVLQEYFQEVFSDFEDKMKIVLQRYPSDLNQRTQIIVTELAEVNSVWPSLPTEFSTSFYRMLTELSTKIASSSGGWLGIKSIGQEEARYINLPMISDPSKISG